jgi:hypothetical protein
MAAKLIDALMSPIATSLGRPSEPRDKLLFAIGSAAIVWYFISISWVGLPSTLKSKDPVTQQTAENKATAKQANVGDTGPDRNPMTMEQFMKFSITAISGTLATFIGMVLGFGQISAAGTSPNSSVLQISGLQKVAAWAYFVSLVYALVLWNLDSETDVVIRYLGQSILGLFGGALAVILNVDKPPTPKP